MEELCPTFEEFCAILGSDPNSALTTPVIKAGYFSSFCRLLELDRASASTMVSGNLINLNSVIAEFGDPEDYENVGRQKSRMRALALCLTSTYLFAGPVGWGDVKMVELILQMESFSNVVGLVLAETLLSLDHAYRGNGPWSVNPILL